MTRSELLAAASDCVTRDRAATHGDAERSFGRIAAYWSAHLDHPVSAEDVSAMMALMKLARIAGNPGHMDSWVDGIGYLACGGEIAARAHTGAVWKPAEIGEAVLSNLAAAGFGAARPGIFQRLRARLKAA